MNHQLTLHILHRDRITTALNSIYDYPLSLVIAPMGYGKTMAVNDFFENNNRPFSWISLTVPVKVSDEDYFWLLLTSALKNNYPVLSSQLRAMGFPHNPMQTLRFLEIVRNLPISENVCLILDDFQYIKNSAILSLINQFVQANIPNIHLIILGREFPILPISEWEIKNLCYIISAETLAFTHNEVKEYLRLINFQGKDTIQQHIINSTNGWIAAIYLMANDYVHSHSFDYHNTVYSMLRNSLYDTYTSEEKHFLMLLSLLDSFTNTQLIEIFQKPELHSFLPRLYKNNALIRRSDNGEYRFHDLFRSFLREELNASGINIQPFANQVALWASNNKKHLLAFRFWLLAKNYPQILREIEKSPVMDIFQFDRSVLDMLFHDTAEYRKQYPLAYLKYIFLLCLENDSQYAKNLLEHFQEECRALLHPHYSSDYLLGESLILGTVFQFNNLDDIIKNMDIAYKLLNGQKSAIRIRTSNLTYGSPHMTYAYYNKPGVYSHIVKCFTDHFDTHIQVADGNGYGADCVAIAEYHLETGDLTQVEYWSQKGLYKADQYNQICMKICTYLTLGRLYCIQGKNEQVHQIIDALHNLLIDIEDSSKLLALDCAIGYLYANLEEYDNIPKWLCTGNFNNDSSLHQRLAFNYIIFGKGLLLKADYMQLDFLTDIFEHNLSSFHYQLGYIHNYIFSAICKLKLFGAEYALSKLQQALDIAMQDNIVMPFAEYYKWIRDLLNDSRLNIPLEFKEKILKLTADSAKVVSSYPDKSTNLKLTQREIDIIKLLDKGLSNQQIADTLYISVYTVKRHIQNIYRKMDVPNKTKALNVYHQFYS